MTRSEILKELHSDYDVVNRKVQFMMPKVIRENIKAKAHPFVFTTDYITPKSKNNWIFAWDCRTKRVKEIYTTFINYHYTSKGLRAVMVTEKKEFAFFTGHFFSRYDEREKLNIIQPLEKVKAFFKQNPYLNINSRGTELENNVFEFIGAVNSGTVLGIRGIDNVVFCNTYLSNEMLKGEQIDIHKELKGELGKYHLMKKSGEI